MTMLLDAQGERAYQIQRAISAPPLDRLLMVYDLTLSACHEKHLERAHRGLVLLSRTLDFEADQTLAAHLFRVYEFCQARLRVGDFEEVIAVLAEVRMVWREAERRAVEARGLRYAAESVSGD